MNKFKLLALAGFATLSFGSANAVPVDLSGWVAEGGSSNWVVQPGNDSVLQTVNGQPTYFFSPGSNAQGQALSGNITVTTVGDNDFIGFALGLQSGEAGNAGTNFMLIDWKQANQGAASVGLSISHVTDASVDNDFWAHIGGVNEIARATNLGSTGWNDNQAYAFDLIFTNQLIQVFVDNILEISISATDAGLAAFDDGAFAFYNYSQGNVLYSAITQAPAPIPEPGILMLVGVGLLAGTAVRARRRKV